MNEIKRLKEENETLQQQTTPGNYSVFSVEEKENILIKNHGSIKI